MIPLDWVVLTYLFIETGLLLAGSPRLDGWGWYLLIHLAMITGILLLARLPSRPEIRWQRLLRHWYPLLVIPLVFTQLQALVPAVHPATYDDLLLSLDQRFFGGHPGAWFDGVASPLLTEVLRACWLSYFLMPFVLVVPLYRRKNDRAFRETVLALALGWLLSFLGYYGVPALGPGYFPDTIPAPDCVGGAGVTQTVALALFSLEGKMHDIFPSGHVLIALIVLFQAKRHRLPAWWLLIPLVLGLVAGTVYLRYHYGVDIVAGALLAGITIPVARMWEKSQTCS